MDENLLNRNRNINRGFRGLIIWQLAVELYKYESRILETNKKLPFKVVAQIKDSVLSISSNIAEGYSRRSIKENLRFYEIALSSLSENYSQIFTLNNANEISDKDFDLIDSKLFELENKMIKMNQTLIEKINNNIEWKDNYK